MDLLIFAMIQRFKRGMGKPYLGHIEGFPGYDVFINYFPKHRASIVLLLNK